MRHSSSRRRCNDDRCAASASARPSVCAWEEARPLKRSSCNLGPPGAPWGPLGPWDVSKQKTERLEKSWQICEMVGCFHW
jgi:hypothetical protein